MLRQKPKMLASAAAAALLTACGGGGGGGDVRFSPPPPATPTPTPTPATGPVEIFPSIDVTTVFATVGIEASRPGPDQSLATEGFAVSYDATTGAYIMDLPSTPAAPFYVNGNNTPNDTWWNGHLVDESVSPYGEGALSFVNVLKPDNPQLKLTYTTLAGFDLSGMSPEPFGWLAFGMATAAGSIPVTGSSSYGALVRGSSVDGSGWIEGSANLHFDFGSGQLSGHFDPIYYHTGGMGEAYPLGRYDFADTIYSSGATSFSGQLANSNFNTPGSFYGLFTGPNAEELMARWSAPFRDPIANANSQMFGVWVGSRGAQ